VKLLAKALAQVARRTALPGPSWSSCKMPGPEPCIVQDAGFVRPSAFYNLLIYKK